MVNEAKLNKQKKKINRYIQSVESDFDDIITTHQRHVGMSKTEKALIAVAGMNLFLAAWNTDKVQNILGTIRDAYMGGIAYAPGSNDPAIMSYADIIQQGCNEFITKMGNDVREVTTQIVNDGFQSGQTIQEISKSLNDELDLGRARANAIARTEVGRANNAGAYLQAKDQGYTHWVADMRDEACETCQDAYGGVVFPISNTEDLPPLHPNCACVVEFFTDESTGQDWADSIQQDQQDVKDSPDYIPNPQGLIDQTVTHTANKQEVKFMACGGGSKGKKGKGKKR